MNDFQRLQSEKILNCYLEKGGPGSGRRPYSSVSEIEDSDYDVEVDKLQRLRADNILQFRQDLKKVQDEIRRLENQKSKRENPNSTNYSSGNLGSFSREDRSKLKKLKLEENRILDLLE